jgi:predicted DCC family thiol-disulfide oxidoreductase YuxK
MKSIILFDGVCNLCNSAVLFILRHDKEAKFNFASLQSTFGQNQLKYFGLRSGELNTIVLIKKGRVFTRSSAALEIARGLDGLWPSLYLFKIIPAFIGDFFYDFVSKNRYRWFGKQDACMVPTPELKGRFIEN